MNPSISSTFKEQFLKTKSLIIIFLIAFLYFSFFVLFLNYKLVFATLLNENQISYKLTVIYRLIIGSYSAFYLADFYELILISLLVGLNTLITAKIIKRLKDERGKLSVMFGGSTVLGIVAVGCSSCGFSMLSILGLTSALSIIPLRQFGLSLVTIITLLISLFYSFRTYYNKIVCKIPSK